MKKILIMIFITLLAIGCRKEEERCMSLLQKDYIEIGGILSSSEDISTKTTLDTDGLLTLWEEGDAIGVYGTGSSNVPMTLISGAGTNFGVFRGGQTGVPVGAYYPYTETAGNDHAAVRGFLEPDQVQDETGNNIAPYDWKVSSHVTGNDQDGYGIHFREIMTMLDINIDVSGTALVGETLGSVTLYVPDRKLAGDFTIDLGNPSVLPVMDEQASDRVKVRWEDPPLLETGEIINARMFMNAGIQAGDTLQIILETEGHITTTTVESAKSIQAGHRNYITLSLSAMLDQTKIFEKFTDTRDGKEYKMVTIGEQVWMAENLAYLPSVVGPGTESNETAYYYVYDYYGTDIAAAKATKEYKTYGVLYNWPAAMTACPEGWHLPGAEEWTILINYLGGNEIAHGKMQEAGTALWITPDAKATNSSGFTGLPGGRYSHGYFAYLGHEGNWWSSNEYGTNDAMRFYMHNIIRVDNLHSRRNYGLNVRCVQHSELLTVLTGQVLTITTTTATCGGNVTGDGGDAVTARGVCWSTSENPTTANSKTTNGSCLGAFTGNITGLSPNTTYYVRAYATNSEGTAYGEQKSFTTLRETTFDYGSFTDSRDGKVYKTITIGEQVWMAENLAYLPSVVAPRTVSNKNAYYYAYDYDGTDLAATKATQAYLPSETGPYETANYYVYDYDGTDVAAAKATENYQTYGVLYTWPAAMTACPEGWHLPDEEEWTTLEGNLGGGARAGGKMKEVGTSHWNSPNEGATNESGFTGLPGGQKFADKFENIGDRCFWWLSIEVDDVWALQRGLSYDSIGGFFGWATKNVGESVRCLQD
ncbi:MAG: FISUMP domain-containing protein [Candidatus Paceibacterota bacterium]|jgi:uncharacterized protein (TIGR02145 family)